MGAINFVTPAMLQELKNKIFDERYPVGKGHWVQFDGEPEPASIRGAWTIDTEYTGRVLVGSGVSDTGTTFTIGAKAGEENHMLTVQEMPPHKHPFVNGGTSVEVGSGNTWTANHLLLQSPGYYESTSDFKNSFAAFMSTIMEQTGGGQSHNNMQPYKVVAVWKRTA